MGNPESEKATRYINLLDDARCNGRWNELPELARKIEKHAPSRTCLTLTARAESQIAAHHDRRPGTATSSTTAGLQKLIPSLRTAIEQESDHIQDAFQATICLGWLHWTLDDPSLAILTFPGDFGSTLAQLKREDELSGWTKACLFKGAYLKGLAQEKGSSIPEAIQTYNSVLPYLASSNFVASTSLELHEWSEWLLSRLCLLSDQTAPSGSTVSASQALWAFRLWAKFFEQKSGQTSTAAFEGGTTSISPRRRVLKSYYDTLSRILQLDVPYTPTVPATSQMATEKVATGSHARLQQRAELKRVEALYETQLLKEMHFPKATQSNNEVEFWVDSVIDNWRILCGSTWRDEELGEGGKPAVAREVLDTLYRSATKTFHSTQILRYLFTVHASLAEFDLAFKAFDSYVELVSRSKDRSEKSSQEDLEVDDDDTIIRTASEAIRILCRFGSRKEAEKARAVADTMEKWLQQRTPTRVTAPQSPSHSRKSTAESINVPTETTLSPRARSVAFRAIGLSQAQWARHTFEASNRNRLQADAVKNFRKALQPGLEDSNSLETQYALGLVLAEMRDIPGAIRVVKTALASGTQQESSLAPDGVITEDDSTLATTDFVQERRLIPLWHLLSLLLTARSEPNTAVKACEAAFEQFANSEVLFGSADHYRSSHLKDLSIIDEKYGTSTQGLVDDMESFEKEGILQIKLTQLAVIEALDGPQVAVASCDELVSLFGRLFPDVQPAQTRVQTPQTARPPKSAVGTVRGSIFRRQRESQANLEKPVGAGAPTETTAVSIRSNITPTPAIRVTDDNTSKRSDGHHVFRHSSNKGGAPQRSSSKLQKKNSANLHRQSSESTPPFPDDEVQLPMPNRLDGATNSVLSPQHRTHRPTEERPGQPLNNIPHNLPHNGQPAPSGHPTQPPKQDARLPAPFRRSGPLSPEPRFSLLQEKRHKMSLLIGVWLFVAELYGRAVLLEDAKEAIAEAADLVQQLEAVVAQDSSNSRATSERGWGGGKSIDELWADVNAGRGSLAQTQSRPHEALQHFELALLHFPDHPSAIVGLSNILLDIYSQAIPQEAPRINGMLTPAITIEELRSKPSTDANNSRTNDFHKHQASLSAPSAANKMTPSELNRLAARDRAYGLLSSLTKLGAGWDYSDAWFTLARAYEESEQIEKAKEVLWWCVELEDARPVRHWSVVGNGGTVL